MQEIGHTVRSHASLGASLRTLALLEQPHLLHQYWMCSRKELLTLYIFMLLYAMCERARVSIGCITQWRSQCTLFHTKGS